MLSFIEIASQLAQEKALSKFKHIAAVATLKNIATTLADALQNVLVFKPQLEATITASGQYVFREDETYFFMEGHNKYLFNPFAGDEMPNADVYCEENQHLRYSKEFLASIWQGMDFVYIINPLMNVMVADFLTVSLNEEQLWVKRHSNLPTHVMQNYVSLENLIQHYAPEMTQAYYCMLQDIELTKQDFVAELVKDRPASEVLLAAANAEASYNARGGDAIAKTIQDFWDRPGIQHALDEVRIILERALISVFPTLRLVAERSSQPAYGYDVFHVSVLGSSEVVVRTLGDYRILFWELNQE